ncbi:MAG: hypothetical protein QG603_447 [Patescibacteria group bacterium]|nr:hypothetical protein [Patescibacteria group bacterium]MDQ5970670.1 hypothetical protein [Patescibacteria group bacterium]
MNLFKKPKYLLTILLASLTFTTFVPQFSNAQVGTPLGTVGDIINRAVTAKVAPVVAAGAEATGNWLADKLGFIVWLLAIQFPKEILKLEIQIFTMVGPYNGFTTQPQVVSAWGTVRDLANMFFILILLLMAFGTILQVQGYGYRQLLSKLLLMAILVNFSKSIVAILIDFSQIVTLTFLAPVLSSLAGNIVVALGLQNIMNYRESAQLNNNQPGADEKTSVNYLIAMILGGIMMIVTTVVMGVILIMFVMRIIGLWIMVILSPLAFLAKAFPKMSSYYSQWENELSKNLTAGPALAFFMWLAFSIVGQGNIASNFNQDTSNSDNYISGTVSAAAEKSNMLNFVIAISLLMAGLKMAASSGAAGASMAGKASGSLQKWGSRLGRGATIGAAAGAGALAWRGTSGEGGVKGIVGQGRGAVGGFMATGGQALRIGALQRGGLTLQAKEAGRRQRKQAKFDKRLDGMTDQQRLDYNRSLAEGFGFMGKREGKANLLKDEMQTTRGPITAEKAREMQKAFQASGDITSLEKLGTRSAAVHKDAASFERMLAKNGDSVISGLNLEDAPQDVINSVASLAEDVLTKGFEGMNEKLRAANMEMIDKSFDTTDPNYKGPRFSGGIDNDKSGAYKARLLQAKYGGKNSETNGLAEAYNSLPDDIKKKEFLRRAKLSGEDMLKIDPTNGTRSSTMFSDIASRANQSQVATMISNLTPDQKGDDTLKAITKAQVRAGNYKYMKTVGSGVAAKHIEDSDVEHAINQQAPLLQSSAPLADRLAAFKKRKELGSRNAEYTHLVFGPTGATQAEFIKLIESFSLEQLKQVDTKSLKKVVNLVNTETKDRLEKIGVKP